MRNGNESRVDEKRGKGMGIMNERSKGKKRGKNRISFSFTAIDLIN